MKALSIVLLLAVTTASAQSTQARPMPKDVGIFSVRSNQDGHSLSIDPVVIVHYGRQQLGQVVPALDDPLPQKASRKDLGAIEKSFYRPGSALSVFSGGAKLGVLKVDNSNITGGDGDCIDLSASVSYHGAGEPRLAANTASQIPGHVSTRRAATSAEISTLLRLVKEWLAGYGLDRQFLERGHLGDVISTELRKGAGRALVGRFDVESQRAIHRLFAIAEPDGEGYRLTLANLEVQHNLADGDDKTERKFLDQLDINNDGVDEVITEAERYENWSYAVWKFDAKSKVWRLAYEGGGGGC